MLLLDKRSSGPAERFGLLALRALSPRSLAVGRAGVGVTMLARPAALTGLAGVAPATGAQLSWVVQMLGAREVAVGVGSLVGLRDRRTARTWLLAGLACDLVDAVALTAAVRGNRVRALPGAGIVVVAATAVAIQGRALADRD